jgi:hypothetical protein
MVVISPVIIEVRVAVGIELTKATETGTFSILSIRLLQTLAS